MGILGKGKGKRAQDAENLKKCIKNFSSEITKISFKNGENFDKITYEKFSNAYNTAFNEYIISKKRFSHTDDVLKKIAKEIKKYDDKPILQQTYGDYCNCYNYDPNKRKKDAAIDQESIIGEYSQMVKQLKGKLEFILKLRNCPDIKTSGKEFDKDSKQKALFEKFKKFYERLDGLELDGKYKQISQIFRKVFDENIKGKGKWFSHTNDVFKAIDKKLKSFDIKGINENSYKEYVACFKYDQKKSSKKAAINDKELFISYQKLYEKILTKLKEYFKYNLSPSEKLEGAYRKYEGILKKEKNNIFGTFEIIGRMKKCFEGLNDGNTICNLFSKVMLNENGKGWYFHDSRIEASKYLDGVQEPAGEEIKEIFKKVKSYTKKFIENRVQEIEKKLKSQISTIELEVNGDDDFSNIIVLKYIDDNYRNYGRVLPMYVIETINVNCKGKFTICKTDSFGGTWEDKYFKNKEKIYLKLETINFQGEKLTEIGNEKISCPKLTEINFDNVEISENVDLENMKTKFEGATVKINGIDIKEWIKEEKNFSDNLEKDIELDNDFNLYDCLNKVANLKLIRKAVLNKELNTVQTLKFKCRSTLVKLEKEAFKIIDKFKDIEFTNLTEIEFTGNLIEIDKDAFNGKPAKLAKITFTGIDGSIENNVEDLKKMSGIAQKGNVAIYIGNNTLADLIEKKEKEEKKEEEEEEDNLDFGDLF